MDSIYLLLLPGTLLSILKSEEKYTILYFSKTTHNIKKRKNPYTFSFRRNDFQQKNRHKVSLYYSPVGIWRTFGLSFYTKIVRLLSFSKGLTGKKYQQGIFKLNLPSFFSKVNSYRKCQKQLSSPFPYFFL